MIAIVDYGMGNVASMKNALTLLDQESVITSSSEDFSRASHIIFPGVGAFGDGMRELHVRGLIPILEREVHDRKKPFLGVCLGMQLLMEKGEEGGDHTGLGWITGKTRRLTVDEKKFRLPHIGWDDVHFKDSKLFSDIVARDFYFVHSYVADPTDQTVIKGTCEYGEIFAAAIQKDNIFGVQFHPEKSQKGGLQLLKNFVTLC
ncbi:MAG: imidazole glycerol phosphate synthase subunit HisH [bacterium]|nr:imidazole glycerol phosphate synthase subunit HisH [bacterium]